MDSTFLDLDSLVYRSVPTFSLDDVSTSYTASVIPSFSQGSLGVTSRTSEFYFDSKVYFSVGSVILVIYSRLQI